MPVSTFALIAVAIVSPEVGAAKAAVRPTVTALSLPEAISLALVRDAEVDRSTRSLQLAAINVADARARYLPEASITVSANQSATGSTYRTQDVSFRRGLTGNFVGTLSGNLSMPVDISGSIKRQVEAAKQQHQSADVLLEKARLEAVIDVQVAYIVALQAQEAAAIDQTIIGSIETLRKRARQKLPSALPFFEVELANAREMASVSQASAEQAKDALKLALRLPLALELELTSPLPTVTGPSSERARESLDVVAAKQRVAAADLSLERAKDFRRPSLRVGAYATQTLSGRFVDEVGKTTNRDYGLNVALNLPLLNFDAGRGDNSIKSSALIAAQARADLETATLTAELSVRQAEAALRRAKARLNQLPDTASAQDALASATRSLFAAPEAMAPALVAQVSNARMSWRAAQTARTDARANALIAALRLSRAVGKPLRLDAGT